MKSNLAEKQLDFESYLIETFNYTTKTAKDCSSRCKRIEKNITNDLSLSVSDVEKFEELVIQIRIYASSICKDKSKANSLAGTLRAAAKKYAHYLYPKKAKNYPFAHGKTKYADYHLEK
jgi:hypothetical protein